MSKRANSTSCGTTTISGSKTLAGMAVAAPLFLFIAGAAEAQQAYYYPQAGSAPVTVNYGAITPYAAPAAPGIPTGFQPYGSAAQPKSVFTPYGAAAPAYGAATPYGPPVYGFAAAPATAPFVAPYANPAFAPGFATSNRGLPISTPTANAPTANVLAVNTPIYSGNPQSYLNVPGAQPVTLQAPGEAPVKKSKKKKKKAASVETPMPVSTPTATEEGAAAQVAAAEAALESGPAPAASAPVVPAAPETPAAAAEPLPAPTPPAEPAEVPASVPSPAADVPTGAASVAAAAPQAETSAAEAPPAEAPATETPATEQVASAEAPAADAASGGDAVLPAGTTRIVFEGDSDDLPQGATGDLDAIAEKMLADQSIKIQVLAYSSGSPDAESQARRKALARGLEVRKYLIGKGVRSNRIDVRALGTKSEGGPADRVDIVAAAG